MSGSKAGEIIGSKEETEIRDHQPQCDNTINALTIGSDFGVSDFVKWAKVTFIHFETIWNVWKWYELGTWDNEVLSYIWFIYTTLHC